MESSSFYEEEATMDIYAMRRSTTLSSSTSNSHLMKSPKASSYRPQFSPSISISTTIDDDVFPLTTAASTSTAERDDYYTLNDIPNNKASSSSSSSSSRHHRQNSSESEGNVFVVSFFISFLMFFSCLVSCLLLLCLSLDVCRYDSC
jgi:hypothetical protein